MNRHDAREVSCPTRILVIIRANDQHHTFSNVINHMFKPQDSVIVEVSDDALADLNLAEFDLIIVGLPDTPPSQTSFLHNLRTTGVPVVVIGYTLGHSDQGHCAGELASQVA